MAETLQGVTGTLGGLIAEFAFVDSSLWREQGNMHGFEKMGPGQANVAVRQLVRLNLQNSEWIDGRPSRISRRDRD
jgi:hypothetical protein